MRWLLVVSDYAVRQMDYFRVRCDLCAIAKVTRRTTSTVRLPFASTTASC
jgi:hypothetical protein